MHDDDSTSSSEREANDAIRMSEDKADRQPLKYTASTVQNYLPKRATLAPGAICISGDHWLLLGKYRIGRSK